MGLGDFDPLNLSTPYYVFPISTEGASLMRVFRIFFMFMISKLRHGDTCVLSIDPIAHPFDEERYLHTLPH